MLAGVGHVVLVLLNQPTGGAALYLWLSGALLIASGAAALGNGTPAGRVAAVALVLLGATSVWRLVDFPWGDASGTLTAGFALHHAGILAMAVAAAMWFFGPGRAGDMTSRLGAAAAAFGVALAAYAGLPDYPIGETVEMLGFGLFSIRPQSA